MSIGFLFITISFTKIILTNVFIIIILFHVIINRDRFGRWLSSVLQNEGALVVHFCLVLLGEALPIPLLVDLDEVCSIAPYTLGTAGTRGSNF